MSALAARFDGESPVERLPWSFPFDVDRYDRRVALTGVERQTLLVELGPAHLRRSRAHGADQRMAHWATLSRLVGPLDDARALLHHGDAARYRRASAHAAGLVLQHCADTHRNYWGWTVTDWAALCCPSTERFLAARTVPTETTVRPFLVAIGYLLGDFTDVQRLGTFNRLHLAQLILGAPLVEGSMRQAGQILHRWGYRGVLTDSSRWRGMLSQTLLINRSPRLEDLSTEAFTRLRAHPANADVHGQMLYALQRAVAALRHCAPPVRSTHNTMARYACTFELFVEIVLAAVLAPGASRTQPPASERRRLLGILVTSQDSMMSRCASPRLSLDVEPNQIIERDDPSRTTRATLAGTCCARATNSCSTFSSATPRSGTGTPRSARANRVGRTPEPGTVWGIQRA